MRNPFRLQRKSVLAGLAVLSVVSVALLFQNCSQGFSVQQLSFQLPIEHPSIHEAVNDPAPEPPPIATTKLLIADQRYIESVLRQALLAPTSDQNETNHFNNILYAEFTREQHLLGRGCDPIEAGSNNPCYFNLNNASIAMNPSTSSGREAARLQICRRVLENNTMMARIIGKISEGSEVPTEQSIQNAVRLFYQDMDDDVVAYAVKALGDVDAAMAKGNESNMDRWKVLMLSVCESSGWEAL